MNESAVLYALTTLAQTCAALAAFVGALGLFRLQMLRDQWRQAEFEYRARVGQIKTYDTHNMPIEGVFGLAADITNAEDATKVAEALKTWKALEPRIRRTTETLVMFETCAEVVVDLPRRRDPQKLLFTSPLGRPWDESQLHTFWRRAIRAAGVRSRPPAQLRHTLTSWLLANNAPLTYVAANGGWANATTPLIYYSRWLPSPTSLLAQLPATQAQPISRRRRISS